MPSARFDLLAKDVIDADTDDFRLLAPFSFGRPRLEESLKLLKVDPPAAAHFEGALNPALFEHLVERRATDAEIVCCLLDADQ
jgi:hypothetical protein